jgi:hypothetical protein
MHLPKLTFGLAALLIAVSAHATLPSNAGKARQILTVTQKVNDGAVAVYANVSPLVNSTAGFGPNVLRTRVQDTDSVGQMPALVVSTGMSESQILAQANAWVNGNAKSLANNMSAWMQKNGVSYAWFSYEQKLLIGYGATVSTGGSTDTGGSTGGSWGSGGGGFYGGTVHAYSVSPMLMVADPDAGGGGGGSTGGSGALTSGTEERLLLWNMTTDQNGRLLYGSPKIVPRKPKTLKVVYTPLKTDSKLPSGWEYADHPGQFFVQTRDENFNVIPGTDEVVDVHGAYDEEVENVVAGNQTPDSAVAFDPEQTVRQMMQGGAGQASVKDLMDARGASIAVVDYIRKVQAVYKESPVGSGNMVPDAKLKITSRKLTYDCADANYENVGTYSVRLVSKMTRYLVSPNGQYVPIMEAQSEDSELSTANYTRTMRIRPEDIPNIDHLVMDPWDVDNPEMLDISSVPFDSPADLAPLTVIGTPQNIAIDTTSTVIASASKSARLYVACDALKGTISIGAGWNGYTPLTEFINREPATKGISTAGCGGSVTYNVTADGQRSLSLSMDSCGNDLLHGNWNTINSYYYEDGLGSLFPMYCSPGSWGGASGESVLGGSVVSNSRSGCVYGITTGLNVPPSGLYGGACGADTHIWAPPTVTVVPSTTTPPSGGGGSDPRAPVAAYLAEVPVEPVDPGTTTPPATTTITTYTAYSCVTSPKSTWTRGF